MSRYQCAGKEPRYRLIVGWDTTLSSFFAHVEDLAWQSGGREIDPDAAIGDSPDEGLVVWIGAEAPIHEITPFCEAVAAYGRIPEEVLQRLRQDQQARRRVGRGQIPPEVMRLAGKRYSQQRRKKE